MSTSDTPNTTRWRPIRTAPKDGRPFLAIDQFGQHRIVSRSRHIKARWQPHGEGWSSFNAKWWQPLDPLPSNRARFRPERTDADGWTDWIHPLPGYLMKCCECGLVHEVELRIDAAGRPNFRMRRNDT